MAFDEKLLDELEIEDKRSFRHVGLYGELEEVLRRAKYRFRVLTGPLEGRADRALLLNLTFWSADAGGDVLCEPVLPADVVAHVAWHHLAAKAVTPRSVEGMFLGESIASAFDVYLAGRLLGHAPKSTFLATQVPAMADAAADAGLDDEGFEALLEYINADPDRAFNELRALLYDATLALYHATPANALATLAAFDKHRFAPLLHHYELSNWVLYARAYGDKTPDERAIAIDKSLREEKAPLDWLTAQWVTPALKA